MRRRVLLLLLLLVGPSSNLAAQDASRPITLGGAIQFDYLAPIDDTGRTADTFRFRRVRLTGAGALTDTIDWTVSVEATDSPILRDAYLTFRYLPAATVRVGQLVMPFGLEQFVYSSNTMPFTERIANAVVASRDAGVLVSNARPFFGWFSYAAAVTNGTRQNRADNNSAKDGVVRLTATPARAPGFQVSVNATKGEQPEGMRTRTGADLSFERRGYLIAAEYDRERLSGQPEKNAGYLLGAVRLYPRSSHRGFHHLEFGARFARTNNLEQPHTQWDLTANYYVRAEVRFMCSLILHPDHEPGDPGSTLHARANIRF